MINDASTLDLDDLDEGQITETGDFSESNSSESTYIESDTPENDFNLTEELLATQGIYDKDRIKFEDESGAVVEKSWDDLSNNERLMILSHQEDPDTSLDNDEIELINLIRVSGLTPDQFVEYLQTPEPSEPEPIEFEVDEMSDDELFCLDLLDKVGSDNISDEELQQALESAKSNETLYYKQVASLRDYYKDLELEKIEQDIVEEEEAKEHLYQAFADQIVECISNFNAFDDTPVELSLVDMENLADFMLTRDMSGQTRFGRLLSNPDQFTKAAFWMLNGPAIMNEMQNLIKDAYLRGYYDSKPAVENKVYTRTSSESTNNNIESEYAYFDEDSYLKD